MRKREKLNKDGNCGLIDKESNVFHRRAQEMRWENKKVSVAGKLSGRYARIFEKLKGEYKSDADVIRELIDFRVAVIRKGLGSKLSSSALCDDKLQGDE